MLGTPWKWDSVGENGEGPTRYTLWLYSLIGFLTTRDIVICLYESLHARGILHGDVELRHIRRRRLTEELRLIDFDMARCGKEVMSWELEEEMDKVRTMCGQ